MPATALTPTRITRTGVAPAAEAAFDAVNGNVINNNDGRSIWVEVTETTTTDAVDLVFDTPGTVGADELAVAQLTKTIAAGTSRRIGPFPVADYGSSINMTVTGTGELDIAAYQIGS